MAIHKRVDCFILAFGLCLGVVFANPTLTDCPATDMSISSATDYTCDEDPHFDVGTTGVASPSSFFSSTFNDTINTWHFEYSADLFLVNATLCPTNATLPITCTYLDLTVASTFGGSDGSMYTLNGNGFFGMVHWICDDADSVPFNYYFIIETAADDASSDISFGTATFLHLSFNNSAQQTARADIFDEDDFVKFDMIDYDTEAFYMQDARPGYHVFFTSSDVSIKLSENHYDIMTAAAPDSNYTIAAQTAAPACANSYHLMFPGATPDSSNILEGSLLPLALAMFLHVLAGMKN